MVQHASCEISCEESIWDIYRVDIPRGCGYGPKWSKNRQHQSTVNPQDWFCLVLNHALWGNDHVDPRADDQIINGLSHHSVSCEAKLEKRKTACTCMCQNVPKCAKKYVTCPLNQLVDNGWYSYSPLNGNKLRYTTPFPDLPPAAAHGQPMFSVPSPTPSIQLQVKLWTPTVEPQQAWRESNSPFATLAKMSNSLSCPFYGRK